MLGKEKPRECNEQGGITVAFLSLNRSTVQGSWAYLSLLSSIGLVLIHTQFLRSDWEPAIFPILISLVIFLPSYVKERLKTREIAKGGDIFLSVSGSNMIWGFRIRGPPE